MRRRQFIGVLAGAGAVATLPRTFWAELATAAPPALPGVSPYGPLGVPDANGLALPAGFTSRIIAVTGETVGPTSHVWHGAPDGGGCVPTDDGGWIYVSNAEIGDQLGGAASIRFDTGGEVVDAYTVLSGTDRNCAGGITPWNTWLSCEEAGRSGEVFECDPYQPGQGVKRPLLGAFNHEAAAVDPATGDVYLTEDAEEGRLYKFVPVTPGDMSAGSLFAAAVTDDVVSWIPTSSDVADRQPETAVFRGGEGIYLGDGVIYFATKIDRRVWELDLTSSVLSVAYDCVANPDGALSHVDNVVVHGPTGRVFVAEDGGNMELCVLADDGTGRRVVDAFVRITGHSGSEVTGPAFSPDGTRLYLSSQRGADGVHGVTYEITGPFDAVVEPEPEPEPQQLVVPVDAGTYVRGGSYATQNFSGSRTLQICRNGSPEYTRRTLVSAPIGALPGPYERATLRFSARVWTGASSAEVAGVSETWDAATLTWNTQPTVGATVAGIDLTGDRQRFEVDVTDIVNAAHAAGNRRASFSIRQTPSNGPLGYVDGPGSADAPELVLVSGAPPPPPVEQVTLTLPIDRDTWVRGGSNADTNFATGRLLQVCDNGNEQYAREAYLGASLPPLERPIVVATLRINARLWQGGPSAMAVIATGGEWVDTALTWNSRPADGAQAASFEVVDDQSRWYEIDVAAHVEAQRLIGADSVGFVIRQAERNGPVVYVNPSNHWTDDRPELVVTY